MLPQAGTQLREEFERVVAEDLATDACGVFFEQVAARDFFREDFRQAAAGELRHAIDPLRMVKVGTPQSASMRTGGPAGLRIKETIRDPLKG